MTTTVHSRSYARWSGTLGSPRWTWLAITETGARLAFRGGIMKATLFTGLASASWAVIAFYLVNQIETLESATQIRNMTNMLGQMLAVDLTQVPQDFDAIRAGIWRSTFFLLLHAQLIWVIVLGARLGPGLVSRDLQVNALPLYFARPISPLTYLLAKVLIPTLYFAGVIVLPNLIALAAGAAITGGLQTVGETLLLSVQVLLAGLGVAIIAGAVLAALSSLTSDPRLVTVGWLAVLAIPEFTQWFLTSTLRGDELAPWMQCVSLRENVLHALRTVIDPQSAWEAAGIPSEFLPELLRGVIDTNLPLFILAAMGGSAFLIGFWRVLKFSRSASTAA